MHAKTAEIMLGAIPLKAFQLPDGSYAMSQESCCAAIGKPRNSIQKIAAGKSDCSEKLSTELDKLEPLHIEASKSRIKPVSMTAAMIYWTYWADKGNTQAKALLIACTMEALSRRLDEAFGVEKTEEVRNNEIEQARLFWEQQYKTAIDSITKMYEIETNSVKEDDSFSPKEKRTELAEMKKQYESRLRTYAADFEPMIAMYR